MSTKPMNNKYTMTLCLSMYVKLNGPKLVPFPQTSLSSSTWHEFPNPGDYSHHHIHWKSILSTDLPPALQCLYFVEQQLRLSVETRGRHWLATERSWGKRLFVHISCELGAILRALRRNRAPQTPSWVIHIAYPRRKFNKLLAHKWSEWVKVVEFIYFFLQTWKKTVIYKRIPKVSGIFIDYCEYIFF